MFRRLRAIINVLLGNPTIYRWQFNTSDEIYDVGKNVGGYIAESSFISEI